MSLNLCEDMDAVAEYIGMLRQKDASQPHLRNMVGSMIKGLVFLSATERCTSTGVDEKLAWLCNLKGQVSRLVTKPSKDSSQLRDEGKSSLHLQHGC